MTTETNPTTMATRTCIGSKTFGIEGHEAAIEDFPVQPSRRDGLGTMCRAHWTEYTRALRRAAAGKKPEPARRAAESPEDADVARASGLLAMSEPLTVEEAG